LAKITSSGANPGGNVGGARVDSFWTSTTLVALRRRPSASSIGFAHETRDAFLESRLVSYEVSWSLSRPVEPSLAAVIPFEALIVDAPFADAVMSATDDREPHRGALSWPSRLRVGRVGQRLAEQTVGGDHAKECLAALGGLRGASVELSSGNTRRLSARSRSLDRRRLGRYIRSEPTRGGSPVLRRRIRGCSGHRAVCGQAG